MVPTFSIQQAYSGREATAIAVAAPPLGLSYRRSEHPIPGAIPIGSVEYCQQTTNYPVTFFPPSIYHMIHREHLFSFGNTRLVLPSYVKDLSGWKTPFETRCYPSGTILPEGHWLISKPLPPGNEWRYYVVQGETVSVGWYRGDYEDKPHPELSFPKDITGTVDIMETPCGLELLEYHAPIACGWYGEGYDDYVIWLYFAHLSTGN